MSDNITDGMSVNYSISGQISSVNVIDGSIDHGDGNGTTDYERLINKPKIEGVELVGDLSFSQLNLSHITNFELEEMLKL